MILSLKFQVTGEIYIIVFCILKLVKLSWFYLFFSHPFQSCQKSQARAMVLWAQLHTLASSLLKTSLSYATCLHLVIKQGTWIWPCPGNNRHAGDCFENGIIWAQDLIRTLSWELGASAQSRCSLWHSLHVQKHCFSAPSNGLRRENLLTFVIATILWSVLSSGTEQ